MIPVADENPSSLTPFVTIAVLVACVLAFGWQLLLGPANQQAIYALGLIPAVLFNFNELPPDLALVPPVVTVLSSMFLHGGFLHLGFNMLYLWVFGDNVEDGMGHGRFVLFYLLCGIAAALAQAVPEPRSVIPMIGASGAISGVLGAYMLLHPRAPVQVILPPFVFTRLRLPAVVVLGLWFLTQLVSSSMAPPGEAGVAFRAHIGGFVAGMLLGPLMTARATRVRLRR